MKIIDCHCHLCDIESFRETARDVSRVDYSADGYLREYDGLGGAFGWGLEAALAIGLEEGEAGSFPDTAVRVPMRASMLPPPESGGPFREVLGINPHRLGEAAALDALESAVGEDRVVGLKVYAGYYHFHVHDPVYDPVYDLAESSGIPVMIHMGDTYSESGLLKYSHPLEADELAVKRRKVNFIICHMAEPWAMTTAELVLKNPNICTDCSGIFVGDADYVRRMMNDEDYMGRLRGALSYMEDFSRLLYGTDWPLAPIHPYVEFIRKLVPEEHWAKVFRENALRIFPRI